MPVSAAIKDHCGSFEQFCPIMIIESVQRDASLTSPLDLAVKYRVLRADQLLWPPAPRSGRWSAGADCGQATGREPPWRFARQLLSAAVLAARDLAGPALCWFSAHPRVPGGWVCVSTLSRVIWDPGLAGG
jgi:hypothetical protein